MARAWFMLATIAVVGSLGLGYCAIMYNNGVDPLKDGGLIALIAGIVSLAAKFMPASDSK